MAVLLVSLAVMAILLTVLMPVWKQTAQREKEAELVFRGEQYARAIGLFQRKAGPGALPPSIDLLVDQRYLRKKFKDPITNDDFAPILLSAQTQPGTPGAVPQPGPGGRGPASPVAQQGRGAQPQAAPGAAAGGIVGVTSKSKEKSLRIYKGRDHYNEWQFVFTPPVQAPGAGGARGDGPQRGGRGQTSPFPPSPFGPGGVGGGPGRGRDGGRGTPPPTVPGSPAGPSRGGPVIPGQPPPRGR